MDLVNGGQGEGLTIEELREVVQAFNVPTTPVERPNNSSDSQWSREQ
jgi:hypothetical protein